MLISLDIGKDCDLLHDRPVLSTGRTPHVWTTTKIWSWEPEGARRPRQIDWLIDWLTDWLTISCKVTLNPFVNRVKYFGAIFEARVTQRILIGTITAKAFRIFFCFYPIFKSRRLSADLKLTLHKVFVRLKWLTPAWEMAADTYL